MPVICLFLFFYLTNALLLHRLSSGMKGTKRTIDKEEKF